MKDNYEEECFAPPILYSENSCFSKMIYNGCRKHAGMGSENQ